jgi:tRNA(adenine34) deaminase
MREAIRLAKLAGEKGDVPVGAVIVKDNRVIGRGYNEMEQLKDPTAHAEVIAITSAARTLGNWRLDDATLYVTLEPCPMCAGAILLSRISCCVFGAKDERMGSLGSRYSIKGEKLEVIDGVFEKECSSLIQEFFIKLRRYEKEEE